MPRPSRPRQRKARARLTARRRLSLQDHEERLTAVEARLKRGDARFDSIDGQLVELRCEVQRLPTLLRSLEDAQTKVIKEHFDAVVGMLRGEVHGMSRRLSNLECSRDDRDGLIPRDDTAAAFPPKKEIGE